MMIDIRHVGLVVQNLEAAIEFWCDILGFKIIRRLEEEGSHLDAMLGLPKTKLTTVKMEAPDGNLLEILKFHSHQDKKSWHGTPFSTGFTHIAVTVKDLDETYLRLEDAGVSFPAKPQNSPDGKVKMIYARGPEGVLIEFVEVLK